MDFYKEKLSRKWGGLSIAVACFSLTYGHAYAQPLTLDTALNLAEQYAPTLRANSAQIEGAENVVSASGILPNPKLFVGLDNYPVSGDAAWSVTREGMTMQKIGVMQDFPNRAHCGGFSLWTLPLAFTFSNGGYCFFAAWDFICFLGDALSRAKCQYHVVGWYCYRDWRYGRCRNCNG